MTVLYFITCSEYWRIHNIDIYLALSYPAAPVTTPWTPFLVNAQRPKSTSNHPQPRFSAPAISSGPRQFFSLGWHAQHRHRCRYGMVELTSQLWNPARHIAQVPPAAGANPLAFNLSFLRSTRHSPVQPVIASEARQSRWRRRHRPGNRSRVTSLLARTNLVRVRPPTQSLRAKRGNLVGVGDIVQATGAASLLSSQGPTSSACAHQHSHCE